MLHHLFDTPLVGLVLLAVLVLFAVSVAIAIAVSIKPPAKPVPANFTYVSTVIAGLVLSVAAGVLGQPATVQKQATTVLAAPAAANPQADVEVKIADAQTSAFRTLYSWGYVILGLTCLVVFIVPTPSTHDLVKGVALSTLGFLITVVGPVAHQAVAPAAIGGQEFQVMIKR